MAFNSRNWSVIAYAIPEFPDYYITNNGVVYSRKIKRNAKGRIKRLKTRLDKNWYEVVCLYKDGSCRLKSVHRLVAEIFIQQPLGKTQVNHIDGNKTNNVVDNLEWVSCKENIQHSYNALKRKPTWTGRSGSKHNTSIGVIQIFNNKQINTFGSMSEASRATGIHGCDISRCCSGKRKTAGGFVWQLNNKEVNK